MSANVHFESARSWDDARRLLSFAPSEPAYTAGRALRSLRVHLRDHRQRELELTGRTLEAHYGDFVLSQSHPGSDEAKRLALEVTYGRSPQPVVIAHHEARLYEPGPEPPPDDIDGRLPAVVTWHDNGRFFLIASQELPTDTLMEIAISLYR